MSRAIALRRELPAARHIPYAAHVAREVITTVSGDYIQTFKVSGASFESADDETLNNWHERLNVTWRNIASPNVALWTHLVRRRHAAHGTAFRKCGFAERLAARYEARLAGEALMVNEIYLTVVFRPITGTAPTLVSRLLSTRSTSSARIEREASLEACAKLRQTMAASLARYESEPLGIYEGPCRWHSSLLEFLGFLLNGEWQAFALPRAPLGAVLATSRVLFGNESLEYRTPTRTRFGAILGIKEYPTPTVVGMYDALLSAPFAFILTQSFTFLAKTTGQGMLQRQHVRFANAGDFAVSQAEALIEALDALASNEFVMGDHHFSLQVLADPLPNNLPAQRLTPLNDHVGLARAMLADTGMTVAREDLALEAAFWAQLPGNFANRPRKAPITSRNFAAMAAFHNFPSGRATGNHWGDALALLMTSSRSPYYFSLHATDPKDPDGGSRKDTGHTFICGPTGSGKTVFVGFMVAMLARNEVTQVVFDKDRGLEILVRALGGTYLPLKNGVPTGFNPLRLSPTPAHVEFLKLWLRSLVRGPILSVREEADLDHALHGTLALEPAARRLSRLIEFTDATRSDGIHARLSRWCASTRGDYAWAFDNPEDTLASSIAENRLFGADVTEFLDNDITRPPVTLYLFHTIRTLLDGRRFVCWADEFSRLLADPAFEQFAKDGLKVWRKLNGVLCAATQSPGDALASGIARTIIEQTPTKILFPNSDAHPQEYIEGFGLSEREFKLIKEQLEPGSRLFLVKQGHHSVVCQLDLKGFTPELAVISGRASTVEKLHSIMERTGPDPVHWLPTFEAEAEGLKD
jgi:type IV secretion system protein VirB4